MNFFSGRKKKRKKQTCPHFPQTFPRIFPGKNGVFKGIHRVFHRNPRDKAKRTAPTSRAAAWDSKGTSPFGGSRARSPCREWDSVPQGRRKPAGRDEPNSATGSGECGKGTLGEFARSCCVFQCPFGIPAAEGKNVAHDGNSFFSGALTLPTDYATIKRTVCVK